MIYAGSGRSEGVNTSAPPRECRVENQEANRRIVVQVVVIVDPLTGAQRCMCNFTSGVVAQYLLILRF